MRIKTVEESGKLIYTLGSMGKTILLLFARFTTYVTLILVSISMLLPLAWMLSTSLKQSGKIFILPPQWIPNPLRWQNYVELFEILPFRYFIGNSLYIAFLTVIGTLLSCSLAAFAFARIRFPGRDLLFLILLATMMIPWHVTLIPVFQLMRMLNWIDTHYPLWVPSFFGGAFGTFLMRQYFLSIPQDLVDAARIDGCSFFGIWRRIFMPLSKPALATLGLFTFTGSWNDLISPLIFLNTTEKYTISVGIAMFTGGNVRPGRFVYVMAGATLAVVPLMVLFLSLQRYFIQGALRGGLKG